METAPLQSGNLRQLRILAHIATEADTGERTIYAPDMEALLLGAQKSGCQLPAILLLRLTLPQIDGSAIIFTRLRTAPLLGTSGRDMCFVLVRIWLCLCVSWGTAHSNLALHKISVRDKYSFSDSILGKSSGKWHSVPFPISGNLCDVCIFPRLCFRM